MRSQRCGNWRLPLAGYSKREGPRPRVSVVVGAELDVRCSIAIHVGIISRVPREVVQVVSRDVHLRVVEAATREQMGRELPAQRDLLNAKIRAVLDEAVGNFVRIRRAIEACARLIRDVARMLPSVQRVRVLVVKVIAAVIREDANQVEHLGAVTELQKATKFEVLVGDGVSETTPELWLWAPGVLQRIGINRIAGRRIDTLEVQHEELAERLPDRYASNLPEVVSRHRLIVVELRHLVMVERDVEVRIPRESVTLRGLE